MWGNESLGDVLLKSGTAWTNVSDIDIKGRKLTIKVCSVSGNSFESNLANFQCETLILMFLIYRLQLQQSATLKCSQKPDLTKLRNSASLGIKENSHLLKALHSLLHQAVKS